jgi:hypothetical protein
MGFITVNVTGLADLRGRVTLAKRMLSTVMQQAAQVSAEAVVAALVEAAPVGAVDGAPPEGDAPGKLKDSFQAVLGEVGAVSATATVITTQPRKLAYVRFGTGIYGPSGARIYPRIAAALRWQDASGAVWVRRSIAGMKPNDFMDWALTLGADDATAARQEVLQPLFAVINGE